MASAQDNRSDGCDLMEAFNLLAQGKRNLLCGEVVEAVSQFQEVCKILSSRYGETAKECAEAYLCYGKALLELSRMESGMFGSAVPALADTDASEENSEDEGGQDETKDDDKQDTDGATDGNETANEIEAEESVLSEDIEEENEAETGKPATSTTDTPADQLSDQQPSTSTGITAENGDDQDVSNLQLAWEMLELAKLIYSKQESKETQLKLAEAYLKLGEVGLETEQYDQAIIDLNECLAIQRTHLQEHDRLLAETNYQLGLGYTLHRCYEEAINSYRQAAGVIELKIAHLNRIISGEETVKLEDQGFDDPVVVAQKEVDELQAIKTEILAKIDDVVDERQNIDRVKSMMREATGIMSTTTVSTGFGECSSSISETSTVNKSVSDISHLVRKKHKADDQNTDVATKKVKVNDACHTDQQNAVSETSNQLTDDTPKQ